MDIASVVRYEFEQWYEELPKRIAGFPAKGTIGGALVVLERLRTECSLDIGDHTAKGGSQIRGVSGSSVSSILSRFGETRSFLSEGGRTNRGLPEAIRALLSCLGRARLAEMDQEERDLVLTDLQRFLVARVQEYHARQRLEIAFDARRPVWHAVRQLLDVARQEGKEGPVAQYLVGAKLQLRFRGVTVGNESYSTADQQLDRPGDYVIGSSAFHVTVAPQPGVYDRCRENLRDGLTPFLLVPDRVLVGTRQNAEQAEPGRIAVESVESFVGQNVEELSEFSERERSHQFAELIRVYNERVDAVEPDKSMLIEVPRQLRRYLADNEGEKADG